jgi:pimeloyl-ACP methyl ester carboxylesterase
MSISPELGTAKQIELSQGRISYRERGQGRPVVFIHAGWFNADMYRLVVPLVAEHCRCIAPDWPLGGHSTPMSPDANLSPRGVARLIAELLEELDVEDVCVVALDTGGALAQILVTEHPERIGRLVLGPCDAFTNFIPYVLKWMRVALFLPGTAPALARLWNSALGTRVLWWFVAANPPPREISRSFFQPATASRGVRRDLTKFFRAASPRDTLAAARELHRFDKPALVVWTRRRRMLFPLFHGRRLAQRLPQAKLVEMPSSLAFVCEDQPERFAGLITEFACSSPTAT